MVMLFVMSLRINVNENDVALWESIMDVVDGESFSAASCGLESILVVIGCIVIKMLDLIISRVSA